MGAPQRRGREPRQGRLSTGPEPGRHSAGGRRELRTLLEVDVAVESIVATAQTAPCHRAPRKCFSSQEGTCFRHALRTLWERATLPEARTASYDTHRTVDVP